MLLLIDNSKISKIDNVFAVALHVVKRLKPAEQDENSEENSTFKEDSNVGSKARNGSNINQST